MTSSRKQLSPDDMPSPPPPSANNRHATPVTLKARRHTTVIVQPRSSIGSADNHNDDNHNNNNNNTPFLITVPPQVSYVSFVCGLTAGVAQAGLFNPIDRSLYLSVVHRRPFLTWANFQHPYQGFVQSLGHRALSGGLYYPLEQFFLSQWISEDHHSHPSGQEEGPKGALLNFVAGTAAGAVNALVVNPVSAVKYKTWGRKVNRGMGKEAWNMLQKGGWRPFGNGLIPTVLRDLVFGGCYTFLRLELQYRWQLSSEYQWTANMLAAALATVVSGPFNLARNVQYATKSRHMALPVRQVLGSLAQEVRDQPTGWDQWKHVQNRLRIGWGTARVAVGMGFGHYVYDKLAGMYEDAKWKQQGGFR